jgi:hypothetical protein
MRVDRGYGARLTESADSGHPDVRSRTLTV